MAILVYTEHSEGKFKKATFELLSYANELAKKLNTNTVAVSVGNIADSEMEKLGNYGCSKVLTVNDSRINSLENNVFTSIIVQAAQKENATIVILANNYSGKALAPRISIKLKAGYVAGVIGLPVNIEPFTVRKKAFTGSAYANIIIKTGAKVLTLSQNSFQIIETGGKAAIEAFSPALNDSEFKTKIENIEKFSGKIILTEAENVVSGGRGMKGPENWQPIEELAEILGAATACSRPVSDEHWRPHEEHVGQTGKIIAPNLYIAVGISGAIQHVAGVSGSKCIVAINTDKDAPIFEVADYGIVGDARKVLPDFISAIKELKTEH